MKKLTNRGRHPLKPLRVSAKDTALMDAWIARNRHAVNVMLRQAYESVARGELYTAEGKRVPIKRRAIEPKKRGVKARVNGRPKP